jgi:hypothetical protein
MRIKPFRSCDNNDCLNYDDKKNYSFCMDCLNYLTLYLMDEDQVYEMFCIFQESLRDSKVRGLVKINIMTDGLSSDEANKYIEDFEKVLFPLFNNIMLKKNRLED